MTAPVPMTYTDTTLPASDLNTGLRDPLLFLMNRPIFRGRANAAQSLSNSTWTSLNLAVEIVDSAQGGSGGHSTSVNTSRFTAEYTGWYLVSGVAHFAGNTTGRRGARLAVNGSALDSSASVIYATGSNSIGVPCHAQLVSLTAGDYVELQGFQDTGGALNSGVAGTGDLNTSMTVIWQAN